MKTNFTLCLLLILSTVILSCKKEKISCKTEYINVTKTDTLIDYNINSAHYRERVAVFKLTDSTIQYLDADLYSHCSARPQCKIYLSVQNITNQQLSMNFSVLTQSISGELHYYSQITIPAGATINRGQISDTCVYIYNSRIVTDSRNITYL